MRDEREACQREIVIYDCNMGLLDTCDLILMTNDCMRC